MVIKAFIAHSRIFKVDATTVVKKAPTDMKTVQLFYAFKLLKQNNKTFFDVKHLLQSMLHCILSFASTYYLIIKKYKM